MQRQNLTYRLNVDDQVAAAQGVVGQAKSALERWVIGYTSHSFDTSSARSLFEERRVRHLGAMARWLRDLEASDGSVPGEVQRWAADTVGAWAAGRVRDQAGVLLLDRSALAAFVVGPAPARDRVRSLAAEMLRLKRPIATVTPMLAALEATNPGTARPLAKGEAVYLERIDRRVGIRAGELLAATGAGPEKTLDAWLAALAELHTGGLVATAEPAGVEPFAAHTWFPLAVASVAG